jgi:hypothetical protein
MSFQGSCLCKKITYAIDGELSEFGYCHCKSCQKASGSAYGANAGVNRDHFTLSDPDSLLREYESSPDKVRTFCSNCGSPIYAYLRSSPDLIRIRLGTLDSSFAKTVKAHTFVSEKASWEVISGDAPQFETWAGKDVLEQVGSKQP